MKELLKNCGNTRSLLKPTSLRVIRHLSLHERKGIPMRLSLLLTLLVLASHVATAQNCPRNIMHNPTVRFEYVGNNEVMAHDSHSGTYKWGTLEAVINQYRGSSLERLADWAKCHQRFVSGASNEDSSQLHTPAPSCLPEFVSNSNVVWSRTTDSNGQDTVWEVRNVSSIPLSVGYWQINGEKPLEVEIGPAKSVTVRAAERAPHYVVIDFSKCALTNQSISKSVANSTGQMHSGSARDVSSKGRVNSGRTIPVSTESSDSPLVEEVNSCVQQIKTERQTVCNDPNGLIVQFENGCNRTITVKSCVQKMNGTADCGQFTLEPAKSTRYSVCHTTGKLWYQARPSGSSMRFVPDNEVRF